jgi:hypothetical protein
VTRAQQLEADAITHDLSAYHAEQVVKRIPIAGLEELGEWRATYEIARLVFSANGSRLWATAWRRDGSRMAEGSGESLLDALENLFRDLAQQHRVDAAALRARAAHAA